MSSYSWVSLFKSVSDWIADYENRQEILVQILRDIGVDKGLDDELADGSRMPLTVIDPFTFFATFMKYGVAKRRELFAALLQRIDLSAVLPNDFDGVPSAQPLKVWLFPYAKERTEDMVPSLWQLFHQVRAGNIDGELFNRILNIPHTGFTKLTECMFYLAPEKYFPVDAQTKPWLKAKGRELPKENWEDYSELLSWLRSNFTKPFYQISYEAWRDNQDQEFSAATADAYLSERYSGTRSFTSHIVAFKTPSLREMAFDPGSNSATKTKIKLFLDEMPPENICEQVEEYEAGRSRNHHLATHAPTLAQAKIAWAAEITNQNQLIALCDWYDGEQDQGEKFMKIEKQATKTSPSLNQILYGPPGTGKTYSTTERAVALADPEWFYQLKAQGLDDAQTRSQIKRRYDELVADKRIAFTTFHQSFSYEDFIEGIRAETKEGQISYSVEEGIFKVLAELASAQKSASGVTDTLSLDGRRIWKMSLGNTLKGEAEVYEDCIDENYIGLGWGDDIDFSRCSDSAAVQDVYAGHSDKQFDGKSYGAWAVNTFKNVVQRGDIVIVSDGNNKFRAIAEVTGDYEYTPKSVGRYFNQCRPVRWLKVFESSLPVEILFNKSLQQQAIYELKPDRIKLEKLKEYLTAPEELKFTEENYVLIIDEINRGNISRIFGELITLLEPDKRKGGVDERSVVLPYSKETFMVPDNLYVLGTMNTADKSLAQLDLALRRRFEFVELMPKPDLLSGITVHGVDIGQLLDIMNQRIEVLLDRDHKLGHAYFWALKNLAPDEKPEECLAEIFSKRIIPLLQEYFFADWERIGWVLNDPAKALEDRFIQSGGNGPSLERLFPADIAGELADRRYWINDGAFTNPEAYRGILLSKGGVSA